MSDQKRNFISVNERLGEIVQAVENKDLPLEEVLDLYEEAVSLGMEASALLEENLSESEVENDTLLENSDNSEEAPITQEELVQ